MLLLGLASVVLASVVVVVLESVDGGLGLISSIAVFLASVFIRFASPPLSMLFRTPRYDLISRHADCVLSVSLPNWRASFWVLRRRQWVVPAEESERWWPVEEDQGSKMEWFWGVGEAMLIAGLIVSFGLVGCDVWGLVSPYE